MIKITDNDPRPSLQDRATEEIFIFKVRYLLREHPGFWEYVGYRKPKNPNTWLALNVDLTENFIGKLLRGDSTIALKRADNIAKALKIPMWQLCKPDYDFLKIIDER